jgi:hypothetical protein
MVAVLYRALKQAIPKHQSKKMLCMRHGDTRETTDQRTPERKTSFIAVTMSQF